MAMGFVVVVCFVAQIIHSPYNEGDDIKMGMRGQPGTNVLQLQLLMLQFFQLGTELL